MSPWEEARDSGAEGPVSSGSGARESRPTGLVAGLLPAAAGMDEVTTAQPDRPPPPQLERSSRGHSATGPGRGQRGVCPGGWGQARCSRSRHCRVPLRTGSFRHHDADAPDLAQQIGRTRFVDSVLSKRRDRRVPTGSEVWGLGGSASDARRSDVGGHGVGRGSAGWPRRGDWNTVPIIPFRSLLGGRRQVTRCHALTRSPPLGEFVREPVPGRRGVGRALAGACVVGVAGSICVSRREVGCGLP